MEKRGTDGQATDDNKIRRMRCACWVRQQTHLEHIIPFYFSTATMFPRTRLSVTSYVQCLVCSLLFPLAEVLSPKFDIFIQTSY